VRKGEEMLEIGNCYKILHLDEDCSDLQLRQQYRKFALELHPDKQKAKEEESN
jgi:curved DNA-binding protein CbpA